ncbi:MAG: glutamyl-tRNA reductase [Planctomycetota bacterium]|nr:glutamyl-tRNA reductase [Planctomycetota bacterium]
MDLVQVGIDHRLAPLEVRERLALATGDVAAVARRIHAEQWADEVLLISTCNRTELYVASPAARAEDLALTALLREVPEAPAAETDYYRKQRGSVAAHYLLRVASGLQSAILGETEIQGQVRAAHTVAQEANTLGPVLDRLCNAALHTGKRARTETAISEGGVSHGSAALQVVGRVYGKMAGRTVLVIGAGMIATQAARSLATLEGAALRVANRTRARAEHLVADLGAGEAHSLDHLEQHVAESHVAVFATGAQPLPHETLKKIVSKRREPLLLVDLGLPRCIDPRARDLPGIFLFDLEHLEDLVAEALASRRAAVPDVEAIIDEELQRYRGWYKKRRAAPTIRSLHAWAEEIRAEESAYAGRDLPAETQATLDRVTKRLVNRLLGRAASRVARGAEDNEANLPTPEHLRHVFGLDENEES